MMKRTFQILTIIIAAALLSLAVVPAPAQNPQDLIVQAGKYFDEGNYTEAGNSYEKVVAMGYESPELYYNLANAYFKQNMIPNAILFYEKALKLDPEDEDILYNLNLANSMITDKIVPLPEIFFRKWWRSLRDLMPMDQWARMGIIFFFLLLAQAIAFFTIQSQTIKRISFWSGLLMIFLTVATLSVASAKYRSGTDQNHAIVFSPTVNVKSSPTENSVDLFVIHEGLKVEITDQVESWSEIRIADGNQGWVRTSFLMTI